jgi:murein L,D-transpeptidase YcbB/YkuD
MSARLSLRALAVAVALALSMTTVACGENEPPPVTTAKKFATAVQSGDVEKMLELLESQAVAHLHRAAERASDQVGGRRNVEPHEMLQVVDLDPRFQVAKAELVSSDTETATVRLTSADSTAHELQLVAEDGQWRVRISVPSAPTEEP